MAGLGFHVFGENNIGKSRGDDQKTKVQRRDIDKKTDLGIGANAEKITGAENSSIGIDTDAEVDNLDKTADNPSITADNLGIAIDDLGIITNVPGIAADDTGTAADNLGTRTDVNAEANNLSTRMDADIGVENLDTAISDKAIASLFSLRCAFFLLAFFSELVTIFLPSSLLSLSSTTLRSKSILLYLMTSMKREAPFFRYPIDKMWRSSLNKVSLGMSAVVRLSQLLAKYSQF